jgi:rhamnulokinase
MELSANKPAHVAVDLGAQSCRVSLLEWNEGHPQIELIQRFPNAPIQTSAGLQWDIDAIFDGVRAGLLRCAQLASSPIESLAVDGWGVDYVRIDEDGRQLANPFCYRDERTLHAEREVHQILPPEKLYSLTGIQILRINTLYQLYADGQAGLDPKIGWLNLPEFITHRLGGRPVSEYTNASHTQLVSLGSQRWCDEIFQALGLAREAAPEIVPTGSTVGKLRGDLAELSRFRETQLIVPAAHDTASAIAAIPAVGDDWAFISSGTWSLVGTALRHPCVTEAARNMNFTNLGGVGNTICFLKNVNGLWLVSQCLAEWESQGHQPSMSDLIDQCKSLPAPAHLIDVAAPELLLPGDILAKINAQLIRFGEVPFSSDSSDMPAIVNTILHSLAARYADVLSSLADITGKKFKRLFIVGGGSQNSLLNRLTAERTGLDVIAGPVEATTIGNFAIQLAARYGWTDSAGVAASSVAKWAEEVSMRQAGLSRGRATSQ